MNKGEKRSNAIEEQIDNIKYSRYFKKDKSFRSNFKYKS